MKVAGSRFEELFRTHHPAVGGYARRRVPAEAVDDIVSETLLVARRRPEQVLEEPIDVARVDP